MQKPSRNYLLHSLRYSVSFSPLFWSVFFLSHTTITAKPWPHHLLATQLCCHRHSSPWPYHHFCTVIQQLSLDSSWNFDIDSILLLSIISTVPFDAWFVISRISLADPFFSLCFNLEKKTTKKKHLEFQLFKNILFPTFLFFLLIWDRWVESSDWWWRSSCNSQVLLSVHQMYIRSDSI